VCDSLVRARDEISDDVILQLTRNRRDFIDEKNQFSLIIEQEFDLPFTVDVENYNLTSQALSCNIYFACDNRFAKKYFTKIELM